MIGRKLVNQSLIYGLASLLINGSNFFLIPFYTHYLSPTEYGIIGSVTLFGTIMTTSLTMGLNSAVLRFNFDFSEEEFSQFLFTVFVFQIGVAGSIYLVFLLFGGALFDNIFTNVRYDPYLKYGLLIGLTGVFSTVPLAFLQARSKALMYRLLTSASFIILTLFMVIFIVRQGKGGMGGVMAYVYSGSAMAVIYTSFALVMGKASFRASYLVMALSFGIPIMINALCGAAMELTSKYFIERYISLAELGIFNVSQQMASVIMLLINSINMAWVPLFYQEVEKDMSSPLFASFGKLLIFLTTMVGLGLSVFSKEFVTLVMAEGYNESTELIPLLCLSYIIGTGYWILLVNPITYAKKTASLPLATVVAAVIGIISNLLLVKWLGAVGGALATLITYIFLIAGTYILFRKYSKVKYDFYRMNMMLVLAAVVYVCTYFIHIDSWYLTVAAKGGLLVVYIGLLQYFGIYSLYNIRDFVRSQFK